MIKVRDILPFGRRAAAVDESTPGPPPYSGLCNICGSEAGFYHSTERHPRESFVCAGCGSTSRDRMLLRALAFCLGRTEPVCDWPTSRDITLLETSGYRANPWHLSRCFRYVNLIYSGGADKRCIMGDLSDLPLRSESLDFLLTSDVFEHVRREQPAWENVYRVVKPGGILVLQVPCLGEFTETQIRVEVSGDEDIYVLPPEYHAEETLVYRYYGNDLLDRLTDMGFAVLAMRQSFPEHCISDQTTVIAQKASYLSIGPKHLSDRCWT